MAGLGLDLNDRQTLISNISIIFHAAATIKFDESLKLAVDINVHGTKDVIELAKETTNLKVFTILTSSIVSTVLRFFSRSFTCQQHTQTAI
jgi:fatty acyl-CoA reductase